VILWRAARRPHADLTGEGGRRHAGRWHGGGRPVVYLAEHPALCLLEVRVNLGVAPDLIPMDYVLMEVLCPDDLAVETCPLEPHDAGTARFGDAWLEERRTPLLRVPSAVAPRSWNFLLNPAHPEAARAAVASIMPFAFDVRLFR
jgi:RES domain-containing protein